MMTKIPALILLLFCTYTLCAQNDDETVASLTKQKETLVLEEKEQLKKEVERINKRYESNEISKQEADSLKMVVAEHHAANIENRMAILNNKIALLQRNTASKTDSIHKEHTTEISKTIEINLNRRKYKRTTSGPVIAFGLNNVITEGESFNESDYRIGKSKFFEIGYSWKTRILENNNWLRLKYGLHFQFNGLRPNGNRYFVDTGEITELQDYPHQLKKSKLRMDNLVIPIHIEFGPSKQLGSDDNVGYSTSKHFRMGLGGYAGVNLGTRQKLKYTEDGKNRKTKIKEDYNTSNLIYGISGYIGWSSFSLYTKYDLNTFFQDHAPKQHNISFGLRFDWD